MASAHPFAVKGDDLVIKHSRSGLSLGDNLRLEAAFAISGNRNGHRSLLCFYRLLTGAISAIDAAMTLISGIAKMSVHLALQSLLNQMLAHLLDERFNFITFQLSGWNTGDSLFKLDSVVNPLLFPLRD